MLVEIAPLPALKVFGAEVDWVAHDEFDGAEKPGPAATGKRFERAENAHGHDGGKGFGDDETEAWLSFLQLAVEGARAFGKND